MCPICKGILATYTGNIYRCQSCGLGVTFPIPRPDYKSYHRDPQYFANSNLFANIFLKRVQLLQKNKRNGRALEIGSSTGLLLSQLKSLGWQVQGIDPSALAAKIANNSGVPTIVSTIEKLKIKKKYYDVVVLNHVLEHVVNPKFVVKKIHTLLKKGGIMLIDVPNFGSLSSRVLKSRWPYLLTSEHLWHFTPKSLSMLVSLSGYKVLHQESRSGIWDCGQPLKHLYQSFMHLKKSFILDFVSAIPSYLVTSANLGTSLTVIAQKI